MTRLPPAPVMTVINLVGTEIARRIWRGSNEHDLQEALAVMLVTLPGHHRLEREHVLDDKSRVDFALVLPDQPAPNVIALEVKVKGGTVAVARQVQRYAACPTVAAVILASTSPRLLAALPRTFDGVSLFPIVLRRI